VSKDISKLKQHEIEAYINEPHKKSGDLLTGYRIALDPSKWEKERENADLAAVEQEDNAPVDQLDSDNEDDGAKKPVKPKKRKRESEAPPPKPKAKPKAKGEKKAPSSRGKKNGTKSKEMVESEDDGEPEAEAEEDEEAGSSAKAAPPPSKKPKREKEDDIDRMFAVCPHATPFVLIFSIQPPWKGIAKLRKSENGDTDYRRPFWAAKGYLQLMYVLSVIGQSIVNQRFSRRCLLSINFFQLSRITTIPTSYYTFQCVPHPIVHGCNVYSLLLLPKFPCSFPKSVRSCVTLLLYPRIRFLATMNSSFGHERSQWSTNGTLFLALAKEMRIWLKALSTVHQQMRTLLQRRKSILRRRLQWRTALPLLWTHRWVILR
jgi:hypothetical protein